MQSACLSLPPFLSPYLPIFTPDSQQGVKAASDSAFNIKNLIKLSTLKRAKNSINLWLKVKKGNISK